MFILSQNEENLVPITNVSIHLNPTRIVIGEKLIIGNYQTKERAKEVLMQIVNQLENVESSEESSKRFPEELTTTILKSQVVFKMPKE